MAFAFFFGNARKDITDNLFRHFGVLVQILENHFERDVLFVDFPTIVVGHHGHGGVSNFCFARAFGFAEVGHADYGKPVFVVGDGFGARAEGGAFHVDVGSAVMRFGAAPFGAEGKEFAKFGADGIGKRNMGDDAAAEESVFESFFGAIDKLIGKDNFAGLKFGLQGADSADADDPARAEFFHAEDVGAMVEFAWQDAMAASMARKKNNVAAGEFAGEKFVGRSAEGGVDLHPFLVGKTFDVVKAAAANNADARIRHKAGVKKLNGRSKLTHGSGSGFFFANLDGGADRGEFLSYLSVAAFDVFNAANIAHAIGDQSGDNIGETGAEIGNDHVVTAQRRDAFDDATVVEIAVGKTARFASEAGVGDVNVGAHADESARVTEAVFVNGFVDHGNAASLGEKDDEGLLPVGHEAGMNVGFDVVR